ncbi:MAG: GFA family protein [Halofilum sp. (in: g-proteobacteria)]|nr:GFA family protein [Halofilum sp. (in: g-proteobacteria)]
MEAEIYPGSCLCGAVRFELSGPPEELLHCHCRMCQKAHGAVFATFARVPHEAFRITQGEDHVASYRSSDVARRTFCRACGSTLQFIRDGSDTFGLAVSALDRELEPGPIREVYTGSKVDWLAESRAHGTADAVRTWP